MIRYLVRMAIRNLRVHPGYAFINVVGLSLGLAACFVVLVYVLYQMSFDRYNHHLDDIYVVTAEMPTLGWTEPDTPLPLAASLKSDVPEVKEAARTDRVPTTIRHKDKVFSERLCTFADPEIFRILTLPLTNGVVNAARAGGDFLVISESMAKKYFGGVNPIGETVVVTCSGETYSLTVSAIMQDIPRTSTFRAEAIGPFHIAERYNAALYNSAKKDLSTTWDIHPITTYVLLSASADPKDVSGKILGMSERHQNPSVATRYHLFPLKDMYFHSSAMVNNTFPQGSINDVYVYSSAAFLLLFIGCVNYLLLNLGRATLRTREVGIRRVFGARKMDLFWQMIVEAAVVALLALPLAIGCVELSLQYISGLLGTRIGTSYFHNWLYVLTFLGIALAVASIAGSYVALYLSRLNPVDTLRNTSPFGTSKVVQRRIMMGTQMVIFIGMTFCSITIYRQLAFAREGDMGFDGSQLIFLYPEDEHFQQSLDAFKNELKRLPEIASVSGGSFLPGTQSSAVAKYPRKDDPSQLVAVEHLSVDRDFFETMGLTMIAGKSFREAGPPAFVHGCIVNETAVRDLGLSDPIGKEFGGESIIGVVRDFKQHSFREKIPPLRITQSTEYLQEVVVRIAPGAPPTRMKSIDDVSMRFNKGKPMERESFADRQGSLYDQEARFASIMWYASGVAILVGCLGIFGMSIFVCQQRVKEIGIRKVLGASLMDVYAMVTKEFVVLILVSAIVAFPFAYYAINLWLEGFAYHTHSSVVDVTLGVLIDIVIVLLTISVQAVRAALSNPVKSIRYE